MKHIVSFSGGKDSTCMLLMMLERGMQVDEIIFCDTGMEFPAMYEHIDKVEQYIGREITRLKADKPFAYYLGEHIKTKGKHKSQMGYGWPDFANRWCTAGLKRSVFNRHVKGRKIKKYIGIAYDEPSRIVGAHYPLYDWKITEAKALQYCYNKGFTWGGSYKIFRRVSCWCCPLQGLDELYRLYLYYPELWAELLEMDKKSWRSFKPDYTLDQLNRRFEQQSKQITLWEGLDCDKG